MKKLYELINLFRPHKTLDFDKISPSSPNARGIPVPIFNEKEDCSACGNCAKACPTKAIEIASKTKMNIDYGKCLECGLCVEVCKSEKLVNSSLVHVYTFQRKSLKLSFENGDFEPVEEELNENQKQFQKMTRNRGFNYREVAAAGNNTVECELNASFNNVFDSEGQQVRSVASPKHADAVVYSGPIGKNMEGPLNTAWECMPYPKALIAAGTEAISGGLYPLGKVPAEPDLFIVGDPPRPEVMISAFRMLMGVYKYNFQKALKAKIIELRGK